MAEFYIIITKILEKPRQTYQVVEKGGLPVGPEHEDRESAVAYLEKLEREEAERSKT